MLSLLSAFSGVLLWTMGENVSESKRFHTNALAWTGENKPKIFCFVFVDTKRDTFKNALLWSKPKMPTKEIC